MKSKETANCGKKSPVDDLSINIVETGDRPEEESTTLNATRSNKLEASLEAFKLAHSTLQECELNAIFR